MIRAKKDIEKRLSDYLLTKFNISWSGQKITFSELGIDSVTRSELIVDLEKMLNVAIPLEVTVKFSDIQELIVELESLCNTSPHEQFCPDNDKERNYKDYVNPHLSVKLEHLKIDRTFVRAQGLYLFDTSGRKYIDFMAQYGALPFGHHPPEIWQAICELQSDTEPNFVQPSFLDSAGCLAKRLISLAPHELRYVTFSNSGAEAIEASIKMARSATGRSGILSTKQGFHGKTLGALSATGNHKYQKHFDLPLVGFKHVEYGDSLALSKCLESNPGYFAAFIVEPIQGEGGVKVPPPDYLREAKEICHRHGVLLIIDEVQTGLGRTGRLFACEEEGVCPDIMTLAKALGGGIVPVGATLCTAAAYSENFALNHSSTFAGNALAARAGLATLDLLTQCGDALIKHVHKEGNYLKTRLQALQKLFPWLISEIKGRGFMLGIQFTSDRLLWPENFLGIAAEQKELAQFVASYLLNVEGIRLAPTLNGGDVLRIQPPLNTSREQCDVVVEAIERTLNVLALRQTGIFYKGILNKVAAEEALTVPIKAPVPIGGKFAYPKGSANRRFAFLLHPLNEQSYADYDPTLNLLTTQELYEFANSMDGLIDPVVGSTAQIQSQDGTVAEGDFIMVSHTAEQLKQMSVTDALVSLRKGIDLAKKRGADILGLGAYTSVVSAGGRLLTGMGIALTSGNSYTVVSGIEALESAIDHAEKNWKDVSACVLGANGTIGSCMSMLLAQRAARLVFVGNSADPPAVAREKLLHTARLVVQHVKEQSDSMETFFASSLAAQILRQRFLSDHEIIKMLESSGELILTTNWRTMAMADIVVSATSQPDQYVSDGVFKPGAIICDISRPRTLSASITDTRPDVLVIDGGVIALPGSPTIGPYGIPPGTSYACMAETILLALDGHFQNTSLGRELNMSEVLRQKALARKHGFHIAGLQSFGKLITPQDWQRYQQAKTPIDKTLVGVT